MNQPKQQRPIKFRGIRIDNGEWVYGAYIPWDENHNACIYTLDTDEFIEVDEKTVGQFTGVYDRKDVAIYAGDIVKAIGDNWTSIGDVYWGEYSDHEYVTSLQCWLRRGSDDDAWPISDPGGMYSVGKHELEIIGSIHTTPELMEGE